MSNFSAVKEAINEMSMAYVNALTTEPSGVECSYSDEKWNCQCYDFFLNYSTFSCVFIIVKYFIISVQMSLLLRLFSKEKAEDKNTSKLVMLSNGVNW